MAKHKGAVSKSYPQVKLCVILFPSSFHLKERSRRSRSKKQEELLHKLRDFNTLRDNAGAWEENLLTAEELI